MKDFTSQDMVRKAIKLTLDSIKLTDETINMLQDRPLLPRKNEPRIKVAPAGQSNADFIKYMRKRFLLKYFLIEDRGNVASDYNRNSKGGLKIWR